MAVSCQGVYANAPVPNYETGKYNTLRLTKGYLRMINTSLHVHKLFFLLSGVSYLRHQRVQLRLSKHLRMLRSYLRGRYMGVEIMSTYKFITRECLIIPHYLFLCILSLYMWKRTMKMSESLLQIFLESQDMLHR